MMANTFSPLEPVKMDFVSDGTRTIVKQNVPMTATAWSTYTPCSTSVIAGGNDARYRYRNCSNTMRNAIATTGTKEYWMKDFSHDQTASRAAGR